LFKAAAGLAFLLMIFIAPSMVHAQSPDFSASRLEQKLGDYMDSVRTVGYAFAALLATLGFLIRGVGKMIPDTQYRTMSSVWSSEMIVTAAVITAGVILAPVLVEAVKTLFGG
jgi:hypothetical protein